MKTVTMPKKDSNVLTIPTPTARTGHQPHRSGSGKHGDRRLKRLKTRATRNRRAISD